MSDRVITLAQSDYLHALLDAAARKAVVPCSVCKRPVALTPVQMGADEAIGEMRVICCSCHEKGTT